MYGNLKDKAMDKKKQILYVGADGVMSHAIDKALSEGSESVRIEEPVKKPRSIGFTTVSAHEPLKYTNPNKCEFCGSPAFKSNGNCELICENRAYSGRCDRKGPDPIVSSGPKIPRNTPCPCGSGKKYKKCCL
jgi:uncharacterized protein YchJ